MSTSTGTLEDNARGYMEALRIVAVETGQRLFGFWNTLFGVKS